jgi:CubicO group peptidase (beta-lactamase class C family)
MVILRIDSPDLVPLPTQPEGTPWPTEVWPKGPFPSDADPAKFDALLAQAFSDHETYGETHAFLAVQGGKIVAERYGLGHGPESTHHSWSMAKSMTHALVGIAIEDGELDPHARVEVPEWSASDDPRREITMEHLLRMSSGLEFAEEYEDANVSDTIEMLFGPGKDDVAHYAANKPLEHEPGTFWSYSSGTTNIICRALAQKLGLDRAGFEAFIRTRLLDPIGMRSALPKFDAAGTFLGSSFCFCTARDFARFGLLCLRGGTWGDQQILTHEWVDHARTPTPHVPADEPMGYGGHWWLDLAGPGSFSANGYNGQYIVLVPQKDLILVRHGVSEAHKDNVREWLAAIADCL